VLNITKVTTKDGLDSSNKRNIERILPKSTAIIKQRLFAQQKTQSAIKSTRF
jgi:hypothetical protein